MEAAIKEKEKKPSSNPHTFENFMKTPACLLYAIGVILWPRIGYRDHKWSIVNLCFTILCINTVALCEFVYEVEFLKSSKNMIEGTALMVYIIYTLISELKVICIVKNLSKMNHMLKTLHDIYPKTTDQMVAYPVKCYRRKMLLFTIPVISIMWFNVLQITASSLFMYFFNFDHENGELSTILQFYLWYPVKINTPVRFFIALIHQFHASQVVTMCVLGSESLLTCILLQICMHFDALTIRLNTMHSRRGDIKDLSTIARYHDLILQLMNEVNEIFWLPVFITIASSSFSMCFMGFQVINGTNGLDIIRFVMLLMYEALKMFLTCLLGDMLMESSRNIGHAAYNTQWYKNTVQYQRVIQIIICRAQKPASLNGVTFHEVSLVLFKEIISKSYTFFTLLHTMYNP